PYYYSKCSRLRNPASEYSPSAFSCSSKSLIADDKASRPAPSSVSTSTRKSISLASVSCRSFKRSASHFIIFFIVSRRPSAVLPHHSKLVLPPVFLLHSLGAGD